MAEQFLTLMADFDPDIQQALRLCQAALTKAGFTGTQTPDLSYHISLATFPPEQEEAAVALTKALAERFRPFPVSISHLGLFAEGRVLFAAPDKSPELTALQEACGVPGVGGHPFTPHATLLIDEPEVVCRALPALLTAFHPLLGRVTRLHLCAFWPTREILTAELKG